MAVEHALGLAGRSRCVAKPGGRLFIELGELGALGLVREQLFVVVRGLGMAGGSGPRSSITTYPRRGQLALHLGDGARDRLVQEDEPVVGVIDDVDDLVARQADVDRVQDRPDRRHGEVELEVPMVVPGKGGDAIAGLDAQALEDVHQPVDPAARARHSCERCRLPSPRRLTISLSAKNWAARRRMLGIKSGQSIINPFIVSLASSTS